MPMVSTDVKFYLSGGAANADPDAALGGVISSVEIGAGTHNLFDLVSSAEASAGDTEYRCFYVKNTHATLTAQNMKIWVHSESPSADTDEEIGLGSSAVSGTEQTIADEDTAPSGVSFAQANGEANGLLIGDLDPGEWKAVWLKRQVSSAAVAVNNDGPTLRVGWDTAA